MSFPEHPETIVVKNSFYPRGLREKDVYSYYIKMKTKILPLVEGRNVMIFFAVNENDFVIQRKGKFLTSQNYEETITGRSVSLHTEMKSKEEFGIIDIDSEDFNEAKKAVLDVYKFLSKVSMIKKIEIRFTGKTSFHVIVYFGKELNIDTIRTVLLKLLSVSDLSNKYDVGFRRSPGRINLDLSPNKIRGNSIVLNSLSILGLRCMGVPISKLSTFKKEDAKL